MPTTEPFGIRAAAASADITFAFRPLWRIRLDIGSASWFDLRKTVRAGMPLSVALRGVLQSEGGRLAREGGAVEGRNVPKTRREPER